MLTKAGDEFEDNSVSNGNDEAHEKTLRREYKTHTRNSVSSCSPLGTKHTQFIVRTVLPGHNIIITHVSPMIRQRFKGGWVAWRAQGRDAQTEGTRVGQRSRSDAASHTREALPQPEPLTRAPSTRSGDAGLPRGVLTWRPAGPSSGLCSPTPTGAHPLSALSSCLRATALTGRSSGGLGFTTELISTVKADLSSSRDDGKETRRLRAAGGDRTGRGATQSLSLRQDVLGDQRCPKKRLRVSGFYAAGASGTTVRCDHQHLQLQVRFARHDRGSFALGL